MRGYVARKKVSKSARSATRSPLVRYDAETAGAVGVASKDCSNALFMANGLVLVIGVLVEVGRAATARAAAVSAGTLLLVCGLMEETTRHATIRFHGGETIPESRASPYAARSLEEGCLLAGMFR
jgi:hypothetical protein